MGKEGRQGMATNGKQGRGVEVGHSGFWMVTKHRMPHGDRRKDLAWWGANELSLDTLKSRRLGLTSK